MIITYLGKQFFKIQQGDMVIALNPPSKDSKFGSKTSRFGSHVVLSTVNHPDYNGVETVSYGDKEPFIISGPGDYEIKNIFVKGIESLSEIDGKNYINTIYLISIDTITLCFLGALSSSNLSSEAREVIGNPDILFVPIGGGDFLSSSSAYKLSLSLEPKIIIPMDYGEDKTNKELKTFLKEGGEEKVKAIEKLTIKRKDLEDKEGEIIVLSH